MSTFATQSFSCIRLFFPLSIVIGILFTATLFLVLRDPNLISLKNMLIVASAVFATAGMWVLSGVLWRTDSRFTVTSSVLITERLHWSTRIEIPWETIRKVTRDSLPWWLRWAARGFSAIETVNGRRVIISPTLVNYEGLLREVKARAMNCRVFDPHPSLW